MLSLDQVTDAPADRPPNLWHGEFVSADGASVDDFTRSDVEALLAFGSTPEGWDGTTAGVARLKDGRIIAWESDRYIE